MRKTDKKLERSIVLALTDACEEDLKAYEGFQWLTHLVNFHAFPESLTVICVFDTQDNLKKTIGNEAVEQFKAAIETRLLSQQIRVKDIKKRILFDTEEACDAEHEGNWNKRLEGLQSARHV
ncbi:Fis family transcriptional regulator [Neptuniibacter halophilus]|uniref:Fis family transcriptional regulator n=1 Tax=Neptuniibacter halophilus TaxID=651666 RepID=UPI002573972C|nr:Fis family transcriptional regulator [Neptuniibacter halophilus]